jgi:chemosensory pili system protein ChpA (sensor histidine kinase/response regulator)
MLNYQPVLVKKLFIFDDKTGDLNPLMGRVATVTESHAAEVTVEEVVTLVDADVGADVELELELELELEVEVVADKAVMPIVSETDEVVNAISAPVDSESVSEQAARDFEQQLEDELELKNIFFEEAKEVIGNGLLTVEILSKEPTNLEAQSTLRRVFHTLKGSSRMVGLTEFGDAGWSFEQLINTKLADQEPFEASLLALSRAALNSFSQWVQDMVAGQDEHWDANVFRRVADAMRIENRLDLQGLLVSDTSEPESAPGEDIVILTPDATDPVVEMQAVQFEPIAMLESIPPAQETAHVESQSEVVVEDKPNALDEWAEQKRQLSLPMRSRSKNPSQSCILRRNKNQSKCIKMMKGLI